MTLKLYIPKENMIKPHKENYKDKTSLHLCKALNYLLNCFTFHVLKPEIQTATEI